MANYYVCMLNDKNTSIEPSRTEEAFNTLKDWLRFSRNNYVVYTDLNAAELRTKLQEIHKAQSPDILVIKTSGDEWAAYASELVREWMHRDRTQRLGT